MTQPVDSHLTKGQYDHGFGMLRARQYVGPLKQRFAFVPSSVWNTRDTEWRRRRRLWLSKGIESEQGRNDKLTYTIPAYLSDGRKGSKIQAGTSIFDPVLCELVYGWYCPPGGTVLDPFAGGSVRGIVASVCGFKYRGIELRKEQVEANRRQVNEQTRGPFAPKWRCGDSYELLPQCPKADFLFSCPPYGNLEVYSDETGDISNMPYDAFLQRYAAIIKRGVGRLHDNSFACFVVANYRSKDKDGRCMLDFVGDTVRAFEAAGAHYYNDIVLVNAFGSGTIRAANTFVRGHRKMVKTHQNILIFVKGDPQLAAEKIPVDAGVNTGVEEKGDQ